MTTTDVAESAIRLNPTGYVRDVVPVALSDTEDLPAAGFLITSTDVGEITVTTAKGKTRVIPAARCFNVHYEVLVTRVWSTGTTVAEDAIEVGIP